MGHVGRGVAWHVQTFELLLKGVKFMRQRTVSQIFPCCLFVLLTATLVYSQIPSAPAQNPQNPPTRTGPSPSTTSPTNRTNPSSNSPSDSTSFLNQAIEISQSEIELGRLASSKASDKRVKDFGTMMVTDHSAGLKKLQSLPGGKNTVKLTTEHEILKTRLSGLSGKQFDREYIQAMVSGHRHAVGLFEEKQTNLSTAPSNKPANPSTKGGADPKNVPDSSATRSSFNTDVEKVAGELLPTIKKHLMEAESIENSLSKPAK